MKFLWYSLTVALLLFLPVGALAGEMGKLTMDVKTTIDVPAKFFSQPYHSESKFVVMNELDDIKSIRRELNNPIRCDYDTEIEQRFLELHWLACGAIKPVEGEAVKYSPLEFSSTLEVFDEAMKEQGWGFTEDQQSMNIVFLIECETTNLLEISRVPLRTYLGGNRKPMIRKHVSVIKIVGVKLPGITEADVLLTAKVRIHTKEPLGEAALNSAVAKVVPYLVKQKTISNKKAKSLYFE